MARDTAVRVSRIAHRMDCITIYKTTTSWCSCGWSAQAPRGGKIFQLMDAHREEVRQQRKIRAKSVLNSPN